MKQHAISKQIFASIAVFAFVLFSLLPFSRAHAALAVSVSLKSKSSSSATITLKNDVKAILSATGDYNHLISFTGNVTRNDNGTASHTISLNSAGPEQRDLTFSNLASGTLYTVSILATDTYTNEISRLSLSFTTDGSAGTTPLPIAFIQSATFAKDGVIKASLLSSSAKAFNIVLILRKVSGTATTQTKNATIGAGAPLDLSFYDTSGELATYNFTLTGTEVGAATTYSTVTLNGIKMEYSPAPSPTTPSPTTTTPTPTPTISMGNECTDGIDNNGDGKADYYGVYNADGSLLYEPDPSCFSTSAKNGFAPDGGPVREQNDDVVSTIIPCTDKCTFSDIFKLINNILTFFIKTLLIPIFIIIIMYAGVKYILAQGNSAKRANLKKVFGNLILGIVLILCSWLIVHTILVALGYTEGLLFFAE